MAATKTLNEVKLSVALKGSDDKSAGTQTLSKCNPNATLDGFLAAGKAILALTGLQSNGIKKVSNYTVADGE